MANTDEVQITADAAVANETETPAQNGAQAVSDEVKDTSNLKNGANEEVKEPVEPNEEVKKSAEPNDEVAAESAPKPTVSKRSASPSGDRDDSKRKKPEGINDEGDKTGPEDDEHKFQPQPTVSKRKASPSDDVPDTKRTKPEIANEDDDAGAEKAARPNEEEEANDDGDQDGDDNKNNDRSRKSSQHWRVNKQRSTFANLEESSDPDEIRRQVEFYFSDSNLPQDQYLLKLTGGSENKPVPLKIIHTFKRMQHFQPYSAVRDAVKASEFLDLNPDDEITRRKPLASKFSLDVDENKKLLTTMSMSRSIYAKGFGPEVQDTHLTIEAYFEPYGPVRSVRLRRHPDNAFKGSVFVEFKDEEAQQRFLSLEPKPKFQGEELKIMSKQQYVDEKHDGIIDGIIKPSNPDHRSFRTDKRSGRRDDAHGNKESRKDGDDADKDDWNARRDRDRKHGGDRRGGRGGKFRGGRGGRRPGRGGNRQSRNRDDDRD